MFFERFYFQGHLKFFGRTIQGKTTFVKQIFVMPPLRWFHEVFF